MPVVKREPRAVPTLAVALQAPVWAKANAPTQPKAAADDLTHGQRSKGAMQGPKGVVMPQGPNKAKALPPTSALPKAAAMPPAPTRPKVPQQAEATKVGHPSVAILPNVAEALAVVVAGLGLPSFRPSNWPKLRGCTN